MTLHRPILAYETPRRAQLIPARTARMLVRAHYCFLIFLSMAVLTFSMCAEPTGVLLAAIFGGAFCLTSFAVVAMVAHRTERPRRWRNFILGNLAGALIVLSVAGLEWP